MPSSVLPLLGPRWARALQDSGRTVVSILINEYGSDRFNTTLMRGDPPISSAGRAKAQM